MAIRAGQLLTLLGDVVVDRLQNTGPSNVTVNQERIEETGNFESVGFVRDTPDITFDMESLDVSVEVEALLAGKDPGSISDGTEVLDYSDGLVPIDVTSPFKSAVGAFDAVKGIAIPALHVDSATYRFGIRQNAAESFTLSTDSLFYTPGAPEYEEFSESGTGPYTLANTAIKWDNGGTDVYVLGLSILESDGTTWQRLLHTHDYTDTSTTFTLNDAPPAGSTIRAVYATTATVNYQQTVHEDPPTKPSALRHRDIDLYVAESAATPTLKRWNGVQSFELSWRGNREADEEFGSEKAVARDLTGVPEVSGSVTLRSVDLDDLYEKLAQIAGVPTDEVIGTVKFDALPIEFRLFDPDDGSALKTLYVSDAVFEIPPMPAQVASKIDVSIPFSSESGSLKVYKGARS